MSTLRSLSGAARKGEHLVPEASRAWTRDPSDATWADERPHTWELAKERLAQLLRATQVMHASEKSAAARAAAAPPPPPPHFAAQPPQAALITALTNASKAIRPGEAKLEKATAAQKANQVVCSSQVLLPLQYDALVAGELLIGSAAARGVAMGEELLRMRALPGSGTPHAATAFVLSAGTRLEGDAQGAVPVNMVRAAPARPPGQNADLNSTHRAPRATAGQALPRVGATTDCHDTLPASQQDESGALAVGD